MKRSRKPGIPSARLCVEGLEDRSTPAAGGLDPTFGNGGLVTLNFPSVGEASPASTAEASAVQGDGKVVIVGTTGPIGTGPSGYVGGDPSPDMAIVRLNADGSIDTTFGNNGRLRLPFDLGTGNREDHAFAVGIQSDGRIVVAGSAISGGGLKPTVRPDLNDRWAVARLTPNGQLDNSFGTLGSVNFVYPAAGSRISDMVIYPDDRILLVGRGDNYFNAAGAQSGQFNVVRLLPTGQFDPGFNTGSGQITVTFPVTYEPFLPPPNPAQRTTLDSNANFRPNLDHTSVAIDSRGQIFVAGSLSDQFNDFVVAKITPTGTLDTSFGTPVRTTVGPYVGIPEFVTTGFAIAGLAGDVNNVGRTDFNGYVGDIAVQPDGKIVVAGGRIYFQPNGPGNFTTVRFNSSGSLDGTFGAGGIAQVPWNLNPTGANSAYAEGMAIQPNGKIVLGGTVQQTGASFTDLITPKFTFASSRLNANGTIDTAYGNGGKQTYVTNSPPGAGNAVGAHSLIFTTGGKILLAGNNSSQIAVVQLQNDVTFNPLPPNPVPVPQFIVPKPGTNVSLLSVSGAGPLSLAYAVDQNTDRYVSSQPQSVNLFPAYQAFAGEFTGTIRTATAYVDTDTVPDYVVVTGPGTPTRFAVISGARPDQFLIPPTFPFVGSEDFAGGAFVSTGDMNNDGRAEVAVSPDIGGGPRVTLYSMTVAGSPPFQMLNFFGIDDPNFRGGARTAIGDVNGDGYPDLVVAAGPGGGPRVSVYSGANLSSNRIKLVNDFFAFDPNLRDGVNVAAGDVNGDGFADLVFGPGSGGAPRVLVVNGQALLTGPTAAVNAPFASFFVGGNSTSRGGVRVGVKEVDRDRRADVVVGSAPGQPALVRVYKGSSFTGRAGEPTGFQDVISGGDFPSDGLYVG